MDSGKKNILLGLFLAAVSLFLALWLIPNGVRTPGAVPFAGLSPTFWPYIIVSFMLLMSLLVSLEGMNEYIRKSKTDERGDDPSHRDDAAQSANASMTAATADDDSPFIDTYDPTYTPPELSARVRMGIMTVVMAVLLIIYFLLIRQIGMVFASMIMLAVFSLFYGERRLHIILPVAVILPWVLFAFFFYVANIPIPWGMFRGMFF